jgi:SNF family Na+-dependent transporter
VLSFNHWVAWRFLGFLFGFAGKIWFDAVDYVVLNVLFFIGAVLTSVLVGWRLERAVVAEELAETTPFARGACVFLLRWLCPVAIVAVLAVKLLG